MVHWLYLFSISSWLHPGCCLPRQTIICHRFLLWFGNQHKYINNKQCKSVLHFTVNLEWDKEVRDHEICSFMCTYICAAGFIMRKAGYRSFGHYQAFLTTLRWSMGFYNVEILRYFDDGTLIFLTLKLRGHCSHIVHITK